VDCDRCLQTKRTSQEKGWGSKNRESIEANDTCNRKQKLFARRVVGHAGLIGVAHRLLSLLTKWSCAIMHQRLPYKGMVLGEPPGVTPLALVHHMLPLSAVPAGDLLFRRPCAGPAILYFLAFFFRGVFLALELTFFRRGVRLFFTTRVLLGLGFANMSMSLAFWTALFAASPPRFIAAIILSRTDLALAI
jgi:hypothetical protein